MKIMVALTQIKNALKQVIDPETNMSVYEMGLIKGIKIKGKNVKIKMTLTTPFCPLRNYLMNEVKERVERLGVKCDVELVFD